MSERVCRLIRSPRLVLPESENTEISGEAPFLPGFVRCISLFGGTN
jgi:hypothetical protein